MTVPPTTESPDLSEAGGGISQLGDHGPLHGGHVEVGIVHERLLVPIRGLPVLLVARLIEVWVWDKDEGLDRHKDLQWKEREGER